MAEKKSLLIDLLEHPLIGEQFEQGRPGFPPVMDQICGLSGTAQVDCAIGHIGWAVKKIKEGGDNPIVVDLYARLQKEQPHYFSSGSVPEGVEDKRQCYKATHGF